MKFSVGADPELFVRSKVSGKFISAHDLIPGSKENPFGVSKGAVQPDGVSAEFNINPVTTAEAFSDNIFEVVNQMTAMLREQSEDYELVAIPTAIFEKSYWKTVPAIAKELGCSPDFDAYTELPNSIRKPRKSFRTGAGHIHLGWRTQGFLDNHHWSTCLQLVKSLDATMYFTSLLWDSDNLRRSLYGQIGAFRPKTYGVEYRPLSNAYVFRPELHPFVFGTAMRTMEAHFNFKDPYDHEVFAARAERARKGEVFEREELLDHYNTLREYDFCDVLPPEYLQKEPPAPRL